MFHHHQAHVAGEPVGQQRIEKSDGSGRQTAPSAANAHSAPTTPPEILRQRLSGIVRLHGIQNSFRNREHRQRDQRRHHAATSTHRKPRAGPDRQTILISAGTWCSARIRSCQLLHIVTVLEISQSSCTCEHLYPCIRITVSFCPEEPTRQRDARVRNSYASQRAVTECRA